jgi:hypothetical protein
MYDIYHYTLSVFYVLCGLCVYVILWGGVCAAFLGYSKIYCASGPSVIPVLDVDISLVAQSTLSLRC